MTDATAQIGVTGPATMGRNLARQRDLSGAHTYRRVDADGVFHVDWSGTAGSRRCDRGDLPRVA